MLDQHGLSSSVPFLVQLGQLGLVAMLPLYLKRTQRAVSASSQWLSATLATAF